MRMVAERSNHSVAVDGTHVVVRIWRRPDLDSATGTRLATELADSVARVLGTTRTLLLDLREAPPVSGPESVDALVGLLRACERADVRGAVLLSADPIQRLQAGRVVAEYALKAARVFDDEAAANQWLVSRDR